jgi:simple sugar transport system ATP-binding protein
MALLRIEAVTKIYPGVIANQDITLDFHAGEIHAVLGENGAGKSTLMNVLYGLTRPDSGRFYWREKPVDIRHTRDAIQVGIGMVHQHFNLVPCFSALENIALAEAPSWRKPGLHWGAWRAKVAELCDQFDLKIDVEVPVERLTLVGRQQVEILKNLAADAQLLILDEPTAVLSPPEVDDLFAILRRLTAADRAVVLITHKLPEVKRFSQRVSVLRGGRLIATHSTDTVSESQLVQEMVGRAVSLDLGRRSRRTCEHGEVALQVTDLAVEAGKNGEDLNGISLQVFRGEILGVAGVEGNGQSTLFETICGLRQAKSGAIEILGRAGVPSIRGLRNLPVGRIAEDRQTTGLLPDMSVSENLILRGYDRPPLSRLGWLKAGEIEALTQRLFAEFDVRASGLDAVVRRLSGGNQQKIILARELSAEPELLVISNPVRGLDIGVTEYVYRLIEAQRARGCAVLLISCDLEEIMTLTDRVAVLYRGQLMGIVKTEENRRMEIGQMMAGIRNAARFSSEALSAENS